MNTNHSRRYRHRSKQKAIARETAQAKRTAANRACGPCTLCCTVLGVDELHKPPGTGCPHLYPPLLQIGDRPIPNLPGCSIYGQHPESCRSYACLWRTGGIEDEDMRPDLIGVIFDQVMRLDLSGEQPSIATRYKAINVREAFEGAADQGIARKAVRVLGQWHPILVIGPQGKTLQLLGPSQIVEAMLKEANINMDDVSSGKTVLVD